ncbi:hypothetical protein Hdeb2414_s0014g00423061 [Helianthus debilis subsp. tardiflorus]
MLLSFYCGGTNDSTEADTKNAIMPAKEKHGGGLLTTLSMDNNHLSTMLSMDSSLSVHDEMERELNRAVDLSLLPDINLPLSAEPSPPPSSWNDTCDMLPALNEKSKNKVINRESGYDKSDLKLDVFLVQQDMENMYMWTFKERPENALGKMQLRSYMNGHSRQGEKPFPFSANKGFVRSHGMQRKHYRDLSNPQFVHGIEVIRSPNLKGLDVEERKRWMELTGRDLNFSIPLDASDFGSWRNLVAVMVEGGGG